MSNVVSKTIADYGFRTSRIRFAIRNAFFAVRNPKSLLQQAFDPSPINLNRRSRYVARAIGSKKRRERRNFLWLAQSAHRNRGLLSVHHVIDRNSFSLRGCFRELFHALRPRVSGKNVVDRDAITRDFIGKRSRKSRDAGPQAVREHQSLNRLLYRYRRDVDDPSPFSLPHSGKYFAAEIDCAHQCETHSIVPFLGSERFEKSGRWAACVRDENVDAPKQSNR